MTVAQNKKKTSFSCQGRTKIYGLFYEALSKAIQYCYAGKNGKDLEITTY
jgi:hypothetical protein